MLVVRRAFLWQVRSGQCSAAQCSFSVLRHANLSSESIPSMALRLYIVRYLGMQSESSRDKLKLESGCSPQKGR